MIQYCTTRINFWLSEGADKQAIDKLVNKEPWTSVERSGTSCHCSIGSASLAPGTGVVSPQASLERLRVSHSSLADGLADAVGRELYIYLVTDDRTFRLDACTVGWLGRLGASAYVTLYEDGARIGDTSTYGLSIAVTDKTTAPELVAKWRSLDLEHVDGPPRESTRFVAGLGEQETTPESLCKLMQRRLGPTLDEAGERTLDGELLVWTSGRKAEFRLSRQSIHWLASLGVSLRVRVLVEADR